MFCLVLNVETKRTIVSLTEIKQHLNWISRYCSFPNSLKTKLEKKTKALLPPWPCTWGVTWAIQPASRLFRRISFETICCASRYGLVYKQNSPPKNKKAWKGVARKKKKKPIAFYPVKMSCHLRAAPVRALGDIWGQKHTWFSWFC